MSTYIFTYTRSDLLNKRIEKDGDWYKVNLGAVNAFNAHGALYLEEGIRELLYNPESRLAQKIENGYLFGEMEHPVLPPNLTSEQAFARVSYLNPERKSHHIKSIELINTGVPVGKGFSGNVLQIVGWVMPMGPYGPLLKEQLDNPEVNTAFSIRCFSQTTRVGHTEVRKIQSIVTFDWVTEPGIPTANKFDTQRVSMESRNPVILNTYELPYKYTEESIQNIIKNEKDKARIQGISLESHFSDIARDLKLDKKSNFSKVFDQWS